jgi:hypothetical protein
MEASLIAADSQNSTGQEVLPISQGPLGSGEREVQQAECLAGIAGEVAEESLVDFKDVRAG